MLVSSGTTRILIDTSPDMRAQLLAADVVDVDAVIWTHDHADHCHGIDDLRQLFHHRGSPVRGLARPFAAEQITRRFNYAFEGRRGYRPTVTMETLPDRITIGDITVDVVDQPHGGITSAGLRFEHAGQFIGYSTDFNQMTQEMRNLFEDIPLWVVDSLRREPHPTHPHLAQVLAWREELGISRAVLMHLDQSMDYQALCAELPEGVQPGFDGLEVSP